MAKIAYTKLGLTKNTDVVVIHHNEQEIEVKQYLPYQEKVDLIAAVLNNCQDANNFINAAKLDFFFTLEVIYRYTNITFTDKQKEDPSKVYDLFVGSGLWQKIKDAIPGDEYSNVYVWLDMTANNIYDYRNSIYGILDAMNTDYDNLKLDADALKNEIADPNSLTLLKDVLTKLG